MPPYSRFVPFIAFAALALPFAARAADPQPYTLAVDPTGAADLDQAIAGTSLLQSLRESAPAPPFALIERARGDVARIQTALDSFGFYQAKVAVAIDGHDVSDADLADILDGVPQGKPVAVHVAIARGALYHLRRIDIDGTLPPGIKDGLPLSPGQPAVATAVMDARTHLLTVLQEDGYAFANVGEPAATLDDGAHALDVSFKVDAGPRAAIGTISFHGLQKVHESFVRSALSVHTGDRYRPSAIETARQDLVALGVFSGVSVRAADKPADGDRVPLTFDVQERPRHAVSFSASYSTDLGGSVSATWSHRNLLGNAEQLNLSAAITDLGDNATDGIGYALTAAFIKPRFLGADQSLEADLGGVKQKLDAYDQIAETIGLQLRRKFSPGWTASLGIAATHDEVAQESTDRLYQLLALPLTVTYDSTGLKDPLVDPADGFRANFLATPTQAFGHRSLTYAVLQASASAYFDVSGDGRSVVALRALAGSIQGGSNFDLPPDQRFYAGGSATVRGFRYQSIGPHFADDNPIGATSVDAGTIEFRQRFGRDWGAAAFVDAGQASASSVPFEGALEAGAGAGVRYYTPIGAVRLDVAVPLTPVDKGDSFEIYLGLGQAF